MAKANLTLQITEMAGEAIRGRATIELTPQGAGGDRMEAGVNMGSSTELTITGISCLGGPGTDYLVRVTADHYRPYSFFQTIREGAANRPDEPVRLWVKPGEVTGLRAPKFDDLAAPVRRLLDTARMAKMKPGDGDLTGLSGAALYKNLGALRQACLLNLVKKAAHPATAANCLPFLQSLAICRQDRIFALVDGGLVTHVAGSGLFQPAKSGLHDALPGYELTNESYKTEDRRGNLQVTFMRDKASGQLAADIDIDKAKGVKHGLEVIGNAVFNRKTNPFLIREFLLAADPVEETLDPGYGFVF